MVPPGGAGTTSRIGFAGYDSAAHAMAGAIAAANANSMTGKVRMIMMDFLVNGISSLPVLRRLVNAKVNSRLDATGGASDYCTLNHRKDQA
jgi:hypothetical protein